MMAWHLPCCFLRHDEKDNYHVDAQRPVFSALAQIDLHLRAFAMSGDSVPPNLSEGPTGDAVHSEITARLPSANPAVSVHNGDRFIF